MVWTSILTQKWHSDQWDPDTEYIGKIQAYEYWDVGNDWNLWEHSDLPWPFVPDPETLYRAVNCHVANNAFYKTYTWGNIDRSSSPVIPSGFGIDPPYGGGAHSLGYRYDDWWETPHPFSNQLHDSETRDTSHIS